MNAPAQVTEAHLKLAHEVQKEMNRPGHRWNTAAQLIADSEARAVESMRKERDAALAKLHALRLVCGTDGANKFETWCDKSNARADKADAELAKERARLTFLLGAARPTPDDNRGWKSKPHIVREIYSSDDGALLRFESIKDVATLDAAMKEDAP